MLDNLVRGLVSTTANNVGSAAAEDGDGILANILEPGEFDVAGALAVNTLALVGTDDDIAESSTILEDKHSISGT